MVSLADSYLMDCQIGKKWKCWIQNRVDTIRKNVAVENCYYVPTKLNPADISTGKAKLVKLTKNCVGRVQTFR